MSARQVTPSTPTGVMPPGHAEILVGPVNSPAQVVQHVVAGPSVILVGFPARALLFTFTERGLSVAKADPPYYSLVGGAYHSATWDQCTHFAETGEVNRRAFGVVADGELIDVRNSKLEALDRAADLKATGIAVSVVEVSPELAARLAKA